MIVIRRIIKIIITTTTTIIIIIIIIIISRTMYSVIVFSLNRIENPSMRIDHFHHI